MRLCSSFLIYWLNLLWRRCHSASVVPRRDRWLGQFSPMRYPVIVGYFHAFVAVFITAPMSFYEYHVIGVSVFFNAQLNGAAVIGFVIGGIMPLFVYLSRCLCSHRLVVCARRRLIVRCKPIRKQSCNLGFVQWYGITPIVRLEYVIQAAAPIRKRL